jgi:2-keto-4-pentenoate hydratase/2-oxohepta-3-ene-1,7-dioic acid hydratase in catechol pathway
LRLCRYGANKLGLAEDSGVRDVTPALDVLGSFGYPLPPFDPLIAGLAELRSRIEELAAKSPLLPLSGVKLLSPVANPRKIIGAPMNYGKHVEEAHANRDIHHDNTGHLNEIQRSGLFLKATSSLVGAGEGVVIRHLDRRTDHEVELAVIIGKRTSRAHRSNALESVAGYCIGLDMVTRGPEERSFRKSIDTFSVLGPWLVTADEIPDPSGLGLSIRVNGEPRQDSNTSDLILGVAELIEMASSFYTLEPGDVIMTGTPDGVGPVHPGDVMTASIDRIGTMDVTVRAAGT